MRSGTRFAGVFDQMLPHTPWKAVIEAAAAVREARADLIATVGGGSVTDDAKAVQALSEILRRSGCMK
jgi:maleylacetate reductase